MESGGSSKYVSICVYIYSLTIENYSLCFTPSQLSHAKVIFLKMHILRPSIITLLFLKLLHIRKVPNLTILLYNYFLQDTMIKNRTNCPNNEPKVLKKHACDDNKVIIIIWNLYVIQA